jgi:hypothetical protein
MVVYILQPGTQSFYGNILNWTFLYTTYAETATVEAPSRGLYLHKGLVPTEKGRLLREMDITEFLYCNSTAGAV